VTGLTTGQYRRPAQELLQQIVALRRWTLVQYVRFRREDIAGADKYCARATCVWFHPTKVLFTKVCVIRKIRA
jgi:hypothetical protein